ncbi:MAG: hypothetical protein NTY75_01560 [Candidatus Shapirobacteria bacterium]|nr:hypothetical protein [Candidatus Shapirobacteria bacterium]
MGTLDRFIKFIPHRPIQGDEYHVVTGVSTYRDRDGKTYSSAHVKPLVRLEGKTFDYAERIENGEVPELIRRARQLGSRIIITTVKRP